MFDRFLHFFGNTTLYDKIFKVIFGKFSSQHRSTLRDVLVRHRVQLQWS